MMAETVSEASIEVILDENPDDLQLSEYHFDDDNKLESYIDIGNRDDEDAHTDSFDGIMSLMIISKNMTKEELHEKATQLSSELVKTKRQLETQIKSLNNLYRINSELSKENKNLKEEVATSTERNGESSNSKGTDDLEKLQNGPSEDDEEIFCLAPEEHCKRCKELHKENDELKEQMKTELSERQRVTVENSKHRLRASESEDNIAEITKVNDDLLSEVKEKNDLIKSRESSIQEKDEEIKSRTLLLQEKDEEIKEKIQELERIKDEVRRNNVMFSEFQSKVKTDREENEKIIQQLKTQNKALKDQSKATSEPSSDELVKMREANSDLEKKNEELKQKITSIRKQSEDDKEALRVSNKLFEEQNNKLVTTVTEEKQALQTQLQTLNDENDKLSSQIKTIGDECKELQGKNTRLENENTELHSKSDTSDVVNREVEEQIKTLTSENKDLQTKVSEISGENKALTVQLETVTSDFKENCTKTQSLTSQISSLSEELRSKASAEEAILKQKQLVETENKDLKDQIVYLNEANERLLSTKSTVNDEKVAADEHLQKLKSDLKDAKDKLVAMQGSYEKEKHSYMEQLKKLQSRNSELNDECKESNVKLASVHEQLQQQKVEKEQEIKALKEALQVAEDSVKVTKVSTDEEVKNLRGQVTSLVGELQEEKDRFESYNRICENQKDKINTLEEKLEDKEMELQLKSRKEAQDDEILTTLQEQLQKQTAEKARVEAEMEKTRSDYGKLLQRYHHLALQAKEVETKKSQFQEQVDNLTAQLITAEESMDDRNTTIRRLNEEKDDTLIRFESLSTDMKMQSTRADVYAQDFEAERAARVKAHEKIQQLEEIVKELEVKNQRLQEDVDEISKGNLNKMKQRHGSQSNLHTLPGTPDRPRRRSGDAFGRNTMGGDHMELGGDLGGDRDDDMIFGNFAEEPPQQFQPQGSLEEVAILKCPVCNEEYPDLETLNMHVNDECLK